MIRTTGEVPTHGLALFQSCESNGKMNNDTTQPPADVRGRIIRASILPIEDEETMIARLRAGAEAVERDELDVDDFVGVWSQYLRQLLRASSVPAPADARERVAFEVFAWEHDRCGASAEWIRAQWQDETPKWRAMYFDLADRILALLRTPRGEGEAMDADEIWNHWTSGHEDAALQGLRTATDDEAHRFLGMVADWQRCPKPSDHDAIAALRSEASGQGGIHPDPETWRCRQCGGYAAHYRDCPALRSEAQGEERASKYGALLAFADAISDAVWGGERAWEQDGGLERLSQTVRRWAKERAARRGEGGGK